MKKLLKKFKFFRIVRNCLVVIALVAAFIAVSELIKKAKRAK